MLLSVFFVGFIFKENKIAFVQERETAMNKKFKKFRRLNKKLKDMKKEAPRTGDCK